MFVRFSAFSSLSFLITHVPSSSRHLQFFPCRKSAAVLDFSVMAEWWEHCSAEEIVDGFIQDLYHPQYPSAGVYMHITDEGVLAKVRAVIMRAEVSGGWEQKTFRRIASRPYQYHQLHMPHDALRKNREVYASVIRQLIGLGVVRDIKANYGF